MDPELAQIQAEREERNCALHIIRNHLDREPTPNTIRAAGRRWCRYIAELTDELATAREEAQR